MFFGGLQMNEFDSEEVNQLAKLLDMKALLGARSEAIKDKSIVMYQQEIGKILGAIVLATVVFDMVESNLEVSGPGLSVKKNKHD